MLRRKLAERMEGQLEKAKPCQFDEHCKCLQPDKVSQNWCIACILGSLERSAVLLANELKPVRMSFIKANIIRQLLQDALLSIDLSRKWFEKYEPKYAHFIKEVVAKEEEELRKALSETSAYRG